MIYTNLNINRTSKIYFSITNLLQAAAWSEPTVLDILKKTQAKLNVNVF